MTCSRDMRVSIRVFPDFEEHSGIQTGLTRSHEIQTNRILYEICKYKPEETRPAYMSDVRARKKTGQAFWPLVLGFATLRSLLLCLFSVMLCWFLSSFLFFFGLGSVAKESGTRKAPLRAGARAAVFGSGFSLSSWLYESCVAPSVL